MKFKVSRTSTYNDEKPCKEAKRKLYTKIETRKKINVGEKNEWIENGINHHINENGYEQREFPDECVGWFIDINTLEELLAFRNKYGDVIITRAWDNKNIYELEIYDDYRE